MNNCFVGIDTSNYTTSAAVVSEDGAVLDNLKIPLPVKLGERGIRQSDAVFEHTRNLPQLMSKLRLALDGKNVLAVGVSSKPRDAVDSYMPCFLSGVAAASSFAASLCSDVPIYEFSHQSGHIMAAVYSSGNFELLENEFIAFHVSGGTTEALLVHPDSSGFSVEIVGETADLNAGQAIDRAGVMMGMKFPCGPEIERAALEAALKGTKIPPVSISVHDGICNLSGLENKAAKLYAETGDTGAVSAFVLDFVGKTLEKMTSDIISRVGEIPVLYAGGVMSNSIIKRRLGKRNNTFFAEPQFSADNASGTALLCRRRYFANM